MSFESGHRPFQYGYSPDLEGLTEFEQDEAQEFVRDPYNPAIQGLNHYESYGETVYILPAPLPPKPAPRNLE